MKPSGPKQPSRLRFEESMILPRSTLGPHAEGRMWLVAEHVGRVTLRVTKRLNPLCCKVFPRRDRCVVAVHTRVPSLHK